MFGGFIDGSLILVSVMMLILSIIGFLLTGKPRPRILILFDLSIIFWLAGFWMTIINQDPSKTGLWQFVSLMGMSLTLVAFALVVIDYSSQDIDYYY